MSKRNYFSDILLLLKHLFNYWLTQ